MREAAPEDSIFPPILPTIFEDFFGGFSEGAAWRRRGGRRDPARGSDLRYNLSVSLEDAFRGKQETIKVTTSVACDSCRGSGAEAGQQARHLSYLSGRGTRARGAGFLHYRAQLRHLPGLGQGHPRSVP